MGDILVNKIFFLHKKIFHMYYSKVDSDRFQLQIFRDQLQAISALDWQDLYEKKVDIAILRLSSKQQHELHLIDELGIPFVVADTLVEYTTKTSTRQPTLMNQHMTVIEPTTDNDWKEVDIMVEKCFTGYANHYFSNPYLDKTGNIEGYKEWVRNCQGEHGTTFMVLNENTHVGFFSVQYKDGVAHGGPGGIVPAFEGSGLYLDFHKLLPSLIEKKGIKTLKTSTQVQNLMVQRQWTMSGWHFTSSALTLHLNLFIGKAASANKKEKVFNHQNLLDFLTTELPMQPINQLKIKSILPLEMGVNYTIQVGEPIPNVDHTQLTCTPIIVADQDRLMAIVWLI